MRMVHHFKIFSWCTKSRGHTALTPKGKSDSKTLRETLVDLPELKLTRGTRNG